MKMKIDELTGSVHIIPSGKIKILGDDGGALFTIQMTERGLEISAGVSCSHNGIFLNDRLEISPVAPNLIILSRPAALAQAA